MLKKELAALLNISPAMVSRLAKRGMPTDTLERAERWRRRHLEPGRIKGSRFDPSQPARPTPKRVDTAPNVTRADVEELSKAVDASLLDGDQAWADVLIQQLRELLRQVPDDARPRLSLRVWLALVDYVLSNNSSARYAPNMGASMTADEFGQLACTTFPWPPVHCLDFARDWNDRAINGWPEYADETSD